MTATWAGIAARAAADGLIPMGGFAAQPGDPVPAGTGTVILLGPDGARFWPRLTAAAEWADGAPDPVDRWSTRVVGALAAELGGTAIFPFGADPALPFVSWALRSGQAFISPAHLLVHAEAGLWVSYRGALALPGAIDSPKATASPCDTCRDRPCLAACPPRALSAAAYDLPACHAFLDNGAGSVCMEAGCAVRRACPVSGAHGRDRAQSAHHMRAFHQ